METREKLGHWEMDLVEGKKGENEPCILVISEKNKIRNNGTIERQDGKISSYGIR